MSDERARAVLRDLVAAARLVPVARAVRNADGALGYACGCCGAADDAPCRPGCWVAFLEGRVEDALVYLGDAAEIDAWRQTRKGGALVEPRPSEREREEAPSDDAERGRDSSAPGGDR